MTDRLVFSRQNLADMFIGEIKDWTDPRFVADQTPAVQAVLTSLTVEAPITPIIRSDSSGTTSIFTAALASFSANFKARAGSGFQAWFASPSLLAWHSSLLLLLLLLLPSSFSDLVRNAAFTNGTWTKAIAAPGNEGVATLVQMTTNSLGYVSWSIAKDSALVWGQLINRAGTVVSPADVQPLEQAMENAVFNQ